MVHSLRLSTRQLLSVGLALLVLVLALGAIPARAADPLPTFSAEVKVQDDGTVDVVQKLTFPSAPTEDVVQRIALTRPTPTNTRAFYTYTVSKVSAEGGTVSHTRDGDFEVLTVKPSAATITVRYTVKGAMVSNPDDTVSLRWKVVQGFNTPFDVADVTVLAPGNLEEIECHAGIPSSPQVCSLSQGGRDGATIPFFKDGPLGKGEVMDIHLRLQQGTVPVTQVITSPWSLDRAFSTGTVPLASAAGALLFGGLLLWWLRRRTGEDAAFANPTRIAEFTPVGDKAQEFSLLDDVRPGEAGTLSDEVVNPVDVTATLVDLAVRGHLRITQLDRARDLDPMDWSLERLPDPQDPQGLLPYEETLLDAVAPQGETTLVSEMTPKVADAIDDVQDKLYDEVVSRGWYAQRPDSTRNGARAIALIALGLALAAAVALIVWTTLGLLGLVLVALTLVGLFGIVPDLPARTSAGASTLAGLHLLATQLQTEPTDRMPRGAEYDELSQVLPYTIVLGGRDRWIKAIADADDDTLPDPKDLHWYHAPENWTLADFPTSIDAFLNTVTGKLFHRG